MAITDWLSSLGSAITGGGSPSPGLLGQAPDQAAALDQLQKRAALQAIAPALVAGVVGALGHPRYFGRGGAILKGVQDAADTYGAASTSKVNQGLAFAKDAQSQRRNDILDQATLARTGAEVQNANTLTSIRNNQIAMNSPVGTVWTTPFKNDPQYKGVPFPPDSVAQTMSPVMIADFMTNKVPSQLHGQAMQTLAAERVAIAQQDEQIHAGEAASNENAVTSHPVPTANGVVLIQTNKKGDVVGTKPVDFTPRSTPDYKTYKSPDGKTHTIDTKTTKPDDSWVPFTKESTPLDNYAKLVNTWKTKYPGAAPQVDGKPGFDTDPAHSLDAVAKFLGYDSKGNPIPGRKTYPLPDVPAAATAPAASSTATPSAAPATAPAAATSTPPTVIPPGTPTGKPNGTHWKIGNGTYEVRDGKIYPTS